MDPLDRMRAEVNAGRLEAGEPLLPEFDGDRERLARHLVERRVA